MHVELLACQLLAGPGPNWVSDMPRKRGKPVGITDQGEAVPAQVTFPSWLQGPSDSPAAQLQGVIRACLRVRLEDRWSSEMVHTTLHSIMLDNGWSAGMMDS